MILSYHGMFIDEDAGLYGVGSNIYGQLGVDPDELDFSTGQRRVLDNVKQVATGLNHTIALTYDNRVMTWGDNSKGQLGWTDTNAVSRGFSPEFVQFPEDVNIVYIDAGLFHNVALDSEQNVWLWGDNSKGQCARWAGQYRENTVGDVDDDIVYVPRKVIFTSTRYSIAKTNGYTGVEYSHTPGANVARSVDASGLDKSWEDSSIPEYALREHKTYVDVSIDSAQNRGIYFQYGDIDLEEDGTTTYDGIDVVEVGCGNNFTVIRRNNLVWACGDNNYGQLTDKVGYNSYQLILLNEFLPNFENHYDTDAKIVTAVAGDNFIALLTESRKVFMLGKISIKQDGKYVENTYLKPYRFKVDISKIHYSTKSLVLNRKPVGAPYDEISELSLDTSKGVVDYKNIAVMDVNFDVELDFPVFDFSPGIKFDVYVNGWKYLGTENVTYINVIDTLYTLDSVNWGRKLMREMEDGTMKPKYVHYCDISANEYPTITTV